MLVPNLTNSKFKLFQRKAKWFSGIYYNDNLLLNIFFCRSNKNYYISMRHIDLISRYLKWKLKKSGVLVFPLSNNYPITKKPTEVRMGKGKGPITDWAIPLKKGATPFLFQGKKTVVLKTALQDVLKKLPVRASIKESKHMYKQAGPRDIFFSTKNLNYYSCLVWKSFV